MYKRQDGHPVDHETLRSANVFLVVYFVLLLTSMLLISVDNFNLTTNFTAVASTLNNIGPGLDGVGPTRNFGMYSDFSKFVLMFDMLAEMCIRDRSYSDFTLIVTTSVLL